MKKLTLMAATSVIALCAASSQAQVVLNNGTDVSITQAYSGVAGSAFASQNPSYANGIQQGALLSQVYAAGNLTAPSGYTGLTFAFQAHETGNDFIENISVSGFNLSSIYIQYASTGGVIPMSADLVKGVLTIDFTPNMVINSGNFSDLIYVFTTATTYGGNNASVDNSVSANTTDLAPTPVPEASTVMAGALMVLPLGIGAIRALRKERTA